MTKLDVAREIIKKLDKPQNEALEEAMRELVKEGFFEVQSDGVTLVLTQLGSEFVK
jgi:predicted transcriptional regulator